MACLTVTSQSDLHCHEMVRRSTAPHGWGVRANYLLLCAQCHDSFHRGNFHLGTQLAIKLIEDPKHFNLRTINKISCREKIDLKQVVKYARIVYSF